MVTEPKHILEGKRGIIFGVINENSLAWAVAKHCIAEGATLVITNTKAAAKLGSSEKLAVSLKMPFIPCDATNEDDLENLLLQSQKLLGGKIDFVLHAVAQSLNLRRRKSYENLCYSYFQKTLDISALSFHKLLQTAHRIDALERNASVLTITYIASERSMSGYNDMSDAKALLESIVRNFGRILGEQKQIRVNAISQSPVPTKAGSHWNDEAYFLTYSDQLSPLGNATADDLADLCVVMFSDYTKRVTMQTIYNDGGFSKTLLTPSLINSFRKIIDTKK